MPGGRGTKKSGRGDGGRSEASRQSRRVQGLGPEEHKDLETVVRDDRKAKKAARKSEAVHGSDVEAPAAQDQSAAGSQTQEDQVSPEFQEEHTREGGAQASEGGANVVEPPEVVSSSDESVVEVKPESVRVKEEAKTLSSKMSSGFAPPEPGISAPSSQVKPEGDIREAATPVPESGAAASDTENMVLYVRREVRRWEEVSPGRVTPLSVVYEWPTPNPDANSYFAVAIPESVVRSVMEEVQNFISVELVEWRMVIAGVSFKVNSEEHAAPSVQEQVPRLEYHKEVGDSDLLMTDYDADLLGRQFVLKFRQAWLARMEQEQREFLARERLEALERERLREQRDLDARRQIQELTNRLVHAEIARRDAERRAQDVEAHQAQSLTETQGATQNVMEAVPSEDHTGWKDQMSTMELKVQELEAERERESFQTIQRFQAGQVRDLRATLAQIQGRRATVTPDLATNVGSSVVQNPEIATRLQESSDSKRSVSKKHQQGKKKRRDFNPPSDSDPSSDSSDDDSSSESSDGSSDEDPGVNVTAVSATQAGTTLLTFQPYINSNTLGEFNTKAALRERVHWWERFANMASQGGAARDWFNQLPKHTQRDWKELASAFRKKYCKARSSYSERYFTMEMKNSESTLDFFYRLNSAAGKADIDFRKSSKRLEKHIRRFITKLRDTRLKTSLQGQRFRNIADLEYALEQDEEVWSRSDRDAPPPRVRDFRADNIPQGRFKSKRAGRAYVTRGDVSDSESDEDPEIHARFQEVADEPRVSARSSSVNSGSTYEISGEEAVTPSAGSLASMKGVEWTQALMNEAYPNPNWDKFCEKYRKWGHPEEDCWKDRKCDRCLEIGHPTHMCRTQPCENCGKMHLGKPCEDWKTLEAVTKLARQGALKDMPNQILDKLLGGEANSGRPSN
ncbi:Hypothetical protein PHPALM_15194 [Phytophthora palmivora]|uniref:Retrotransposon gag domain-containing protein n=1 Tax=Phytophthora palmivora TaxID=4796 RepID=A0A2P4XSY7_9STRA|nr:Hypothetical protein PHPALM_15194 [Phytophthora palmivora]